MFCISLDIELAGENVIKELGVFVDGKVQGYSFRPPEKKQTHKKSFLMHKKLARIGAEQ